MIKADSSVLSLDLELLQSFMDSMSWGKEGYIFVKDNLCGLYYFRDTSSFVILPQKVEDWVGSKTVEAIEEVANHFNAHPGVLFHGEPDDTTFDDINEEAHKNGIAVYWRGAMNKVRYSDWLQRFLMSAAASSKSRTQSQHEAFREIQQQREELYRKLGSAGSDHP